MCRTYNQIAMKQCQLYRTRLAYLPSDWLHVKGMQSFYLFISTIISESHCAQMIENAERYNDAAQFLDEYNQSAGSYRPSPEKTRLNFAFCPINLHFQRF